MGTIKAKASGDTKETEESTITDSQKQSDLV